MSTKKMYFLDKDWQDLRKMYQSIGLPLQTLKGNGVPSKEYIFIMEQSRDGSGQEYYRRKVLNDDEEIFAITDFMRPSKLVNWEDLKKAPVKKCDQAVTSFHTGSATLEMSLEGYVGRVAR